MSTISWTSNDSAIWSLLLASGYLKVLDYEREDRIEEGREPLYRLTLTNYEVKRMFDSMVRGWFQPAGADYNDFVKALLLGDLDAMNVYMNRVRHRYSVILMWEEGKPGAHRNVFTTALCWEFWWICRIAM